MFNLIFKWGIKLIVKNIDSAISNSSNKQTNTHTHTHTYTHTHTRKHTNTNTHTYLRFDDKLET